MLGTTVRNLTSWTVRRRKLFVAAIKLVGAVAGAAVPQFAFLANAAGEMGGVLTEKVLESLAPAERDAVTERLEELAETHSGLIDALDSAIDQHAESLDDLTALARITVEHNSAVADQVEALRVGLEPLLPLLQRIEDKIDKQAIILKEIDRKVNELAARNHVRANDTRSQHVVSINSQREQELIRELRDQIRALPADQQSQVDLQLFGQILKQAGMWPEANKFFADAAKTADRKKKAENLYNKYRTELEQRDWEGAKVTLTEVMKHDTEMRFVPFSKRYELQTILGAGGFGTAFLCWDKNWGRKVVIKTLHADDLQRSITQIFQEAQTLRTLAQKHPAIVPVFDVAHVNDDETLTSFLVMDYFPGGSLQAELDRRPDGQGLDLPDFLAVARPIAEAMTVVHAAGMNHCDLKPDNVLVCLNDAEPIGAPKRWDVCVIDFGLALKVEVVSVSQMAYQKAQMGIHAAGTAKYAPPEQLRELVHPIGKYSDIYAFGKLCYMALFRTTQPMPRHWNRLPAELAEMLARCTEYQPADRHQDFGPVLKAFDLFDATGKRKVEVIEEPAPKPPGETVKKAPAVIAKPEPARVRPGLTHAQAKQLQQEWADFLGRPVTEKIDLGRGVLLEMNLIPPGTFTMGSPPSEADRGGNETPHEVTLSQGFFMGVGPVTVGQFRSFVAATKYKTEAETSGGADGFTGGKWEMDPKRNWQNPGFQQADDHPVTCVSWNDSTAFHRWLSEKFAKDGQIYRLPTEAEWEYSCRGGADFSKPFGIGDGTSLSATQANFDGNYPYKATKGEYRRRTTPVGHFKLANGFGLYDMHGNVWEWCRDWYGEYTTETKNPTGPSGGSDRVIRGGGWGNNGQNCRSATRYGYAPEDRHYALGFRLARVSVEAS